MIGLYNNKNVYKEKKLITSRALEYYIKRNNIITLITVKDLKIIKNSYKDYLKSNKFPYGDNNFESDDDENYEKKMPDFIMNSESISSEEEDEKDESNSNLNNNNDNDNNDNEDNEDNNNNHIGKKR